MEEVRLLTVPGLGLIKRYSEFVPCFEVLFPSVVNAAAIVLSDEAVPCVPLGLFCSKLDRSRDEGFLAVALDTDRGGPTPLLDSLGDGLGVLLDGSLRE